MFAHRTLDPWQGSIEAIQKELESTFFLFKVLVLNPLAMGTFQGFDFEPSSYGNLLKSQWNPSRHC